jgi:GGDEF domain-containing protein
LETIRKSIEAISLFLRGRERVWEKERVAQKTGPRDQALPVTLSIGVAEKLDDSATLTLVIKSAYRALYEAKGAGGNFVKRGVEENVPVRRTPTGTGRVSSMSEYGT